MNKEDKIDYVFRNKDEVSKLGLANFFEKALERSDDEARLFLDCFASSFEDKDIFEIINRDEERIALFLFNGPEFILYKRMLRELINIMFCKHKMALSKINELENRLQGYESKLNELENRLQGYESKLNSLESLINYRLGSY